MDGIDGSSIKCLSSSKLSLDLEFATVGLIDESNDDTLGGEELTCGQVKVNHRWKRKHDNCEHGDDHGCCRRRV